MANSSQKSYRNRVESFRARNSRDDREFQRAETRKRLATLTGGKPVDALSPVAEQTAAAQTAVKAAPRASGAAAKRNKVEQLLFEIGTGPSTNVSKRFESAEALAEHLGVTPQAVKRMKSQGFVDQNNDGFGWRLSPSAQKFARSARADVKAARSRDDIAFGMSNATSQNRTPSVPIAGAAARAAVGVPTVASLSGREVGPTVGNAKRLRKAARLKALRAKGLAPAAAKGLLSKLPWLAKALPWLGPVGVGLGALQVVSSIVSSKRESELEDAATLVAERDAGEFGALEDTETQMAGLLGRLERAQEAGAQGALQGARRVDAVLSGIVNPQRAAELRMGALQYQPDVAEIMLRLGGGGG